MEINKLYDEKIKYLESSLSKRAYKIFSDSLEDIIPEICFSPENTDKLKKRFVKRIYHLTYSEHSMKIIRTDQLYNMIKTSLQTDQLLYRDSFFNIGYRLHAEMIQLANRLEPRKKRKK